jgi:IS30 family transposase
VATGLSNREIARRIGRHHSCVSREISSNGGRGIYSAADAHERAAALRARPKARKLESRQQLHDAVNDGLREKWSPQQISKRLELEFPDDPEMRVSHETIYESLYLQARGELRAQLELALRSGRARRVPATASRPLSDRS